MNQKISTINDTKIVVLIGACIGIALPLVFIGRAMLAPPLVLALVLAFLCSDRKTYIFCFNATLKQTASWFLLIFILAWIPNLFASPTPDKSIETFARTVAVILFSGFIYAILQSNKLALNSALKVFIVMAMIVSSIAVISFLYFPELYSFTHGNGWITSKPRFEYKAAAAAGALMIPLLIWVASLYTGKWRFLALLSCIFIIFIMYKTSNRASFAGLIAASIVFLILATFKHKISIRLILTTIVILVSIIAILYWERSTRLGVLIPDYTWPIPTWIIDWHRQSIWSFAWDQGVNNRWFGTGINAIDKLDGSAATSQFLSSEPNIPLHPHNWAVEIIVETGLVGFLSLLAFIGYAVSRMIKTYFQTSSTAMMAALCVWASYWASGMFNFSFWSVWWQATFLILSALCFAGHTHKQNAEKSLQ